MTQPAVACYVAHPPVDPERGRISSRYGVRPGRTTGVPRMHAGLDLTDSRLGTRPAPPAFAIRDGTVERVTSDEARGGPFNGYGNAVVIRHPDGFWSFYAHLAETLVAAGEQVYAGTKVGRIGNTSNGKFPGMGAHLHLEVRHAAPEGRSPFPGPYAVYNVDPEAYLAGYGVMFDRRGRVVLTSRACPILAHPAGLGRHVGFGQVPLGQEYEPPAMPDPELMPLRPAWAASAIVAPVAALGIGLFVVGAGVALLSRFRSRH